MTRPTTANAPPGARHRRARGVAPAALENAELRANDRDLTSGARGSLRRGPRRQGLPLCCLAMKAAMSVQASSLLRPDPDVVAARHRGDLPLALASTIGRAVAGWDAAAGCGGRPVRSAPCMQQP